MILRFINCQITQSLSTRTKLKSEFVKLDEICQNDVRIFSNENNSTKYV